MTTNYILNNKKNIIINNYFLILLQINFKTIV